MFEKEPFNSIEASDIMRKLIPSGINISRWDLNQITNAVDSFRTKRRNLTIDHSETDATNSPEMSQRLRRILTILADHGIHSKRALETGRAIERMLESETDA